MLINGLIKILDINKYETFIKFLGIEFVKDKEVFKTVKEIKTTGLIELEYAQEKNQGMVM